MEENLKPAGTLDLTPTWGGIMSALLIKFEENAEFINETRILTRTPGRQERIADNEFIKKEILKASRVADAYNDLTKEIKNAHSFVHGRPRLISVNLIANKLDLQSTVIYYSVTGEMIGWIHEHTKKIHWLRGYPELLRELMDNTILTESLTGYEVLFEKEHGFRVEIKLTYPQ